MRPESRRGVLIGAAAFAAGLAGGAGALAWRHFGLTARLSFDPQNFAFPPVPGLLDASGAQVPGFSAAEIRGKAVFVHAFASWCPTCRAEHPALMEYARAGGRIYGVASADDPAHTRDYLRRVGNPFVRLGVDGRGYFYRAMGARGIPADFVLAPAPHVALLLQGEHSYPELRDKILPVLAAANG